MSQQSSAHDIVAFAVAEGWTLLPYETLLAMSPADTLYKSLIEAYKNKKRKEDSRAALICAIIANCMGSGQKKFDVDDFMPKEAKTEEQQVAELKAAFAQYEIYRQNGQIG